MEGIYRSDVLCVYIEKEMTDLKIKKRARYIDEAKGLGILCIVFLHYENGVIPGEANTFIGSFMITIFYIVAGWVMAMKGTAEPTRILAKKRFRSLGIPYLYWTGIILAFDIILWAFGYYDNYFIAREAYKSLVLRGIGTLWFLPALFFGEITWNWLSRHSPYLWILVLVAIVGYQYEYNAFFASRISSLWNIVKAPFYTLNSACTALICVAFGNGAYIVFRRFGLVDRKFGSFFMGLCMCLVAYFSANYLGCLLGPLANIFWGLFAPIIGPIGFILVLYALQNSKMLDYFDYWGRNSLSLMVTHYSIVQVLITIFIVHVLHTPFTGWITICAFLVSMPVQWGITRMLERYAPQLIHPANK